MNKRRKMYALFMMLLGLSANLLHANPAGDSGYAETMSGAFFVRADCLYWSPQVTGLELGFGSGRITQTTVDDTEVTRSREVDLDPCGDWSAGYRASAGYRLDGTPWEMEAIWTDFKGKASRSSQERASNEGNYRINLGQIDAIVAYKTPLSPCIALKPFFGLRAARIKQKVHATLFTDITLESGSGVETTILNDQQTYYGMGPLVGLQADWNVSNGFGFYGTVAASLMYGKFDVRLNDSSVCDVPSSREVFSETESHLKSSDCNIDLALGLYWHPNFCESIKSSLKLGVEHHEYFNQNRMGSSRGDLSLDGLSLSLSLEW